MNQLRVELQNDRTAYESGEQVLGQAYWAMGQAAERLEIRLVWYTSGKGTSDICVVESRVLESPSASGRQEFSFLLPEGPHSFSGRLISLSWAVEVVAWGSRKKILDSARVHLVMAPGGREILLPYVETPASRLQVQFQQRKTAFQNGK